MASPQTSNTHTHTHAHTHTHSHRELPASWKRTKPQTGSKREFAREAVLYDSGIWEVVGCERVDLIDRPIPLHPLPSS